MHIGGNESLCPDPTVNKENKVKKVKEDTYLGGIITDKCNNEKKIERAKSKGMAMISTIMSILNDIRFGRYFYEIAILLRESLFINTMLWNVESWYNFTENEIEEFEKIDRILLKKILNVPVSTPSALLYL